MLTPNATHETASTRFMQVLLTTRRKPALDTFTKSPEVVILRVALTVNGKQCELELDTRTSLLDVLREHLHLIGTKKGCDHGQCGACTVLANGRRINSCLTLALVHEGEQIVTIEGLAHGEELHP